MKKFLVVLTAGLILAMLVVPSLAASKQDQDQAQKTLVELRLKQIDLQKQAVTAQVQAGYLTKAQGDAIIAQLDLRAKYIKENPTATYGPGAGYGYGRGMMGGRGRGMMGGVDGGMMGAAGCPMYSGVPAPAPAPSK